MPFTVSPEPNTLSIVDVKEATLPAASTATKCDVPASWSTAAAARRSAPAGVPAVTCGMARSGEMSSERAAR